MPRSAVPSAFVSAIQLAFALTLSVSSGCGRSFELLDPEAFPVGWYMVPDPLGIGALATPAPVRLNEDGTGWIKQTPGSECSTNSDGSLLRFEWSVLDEDRFTVFRFSQATDRRTETEYRRTEDCSRFDFKPPPDGDKNALVIRHPLVSGELCYDLRDDGECDVSICPGTQPGC